MEIKRELESPSEDLKRKHYIQKHNVAWEKLPGLKEWVTTSEKSPYYSYCKACNKHITSGSGKSDLYRHAKGKRHQNLIAKYINNSHSITVKWKVDGQIESHEVSSQLDQLQQSADSESIEMMVDDLGESSLSGHDRSEEKAPLHSSPVKERRVYAVKKKIIKKEMNIITTTNGITGHRALVTGGGSGIGFAIAKRLAEMGAYVYIMGRNVENLQQAVNDCNGLNMTAIQVDVSDWDTARVALQEILPIQLLVNNAGDNILKSVLEANEDEYEQIMGVNLKAAINLTQGVAKDLVKKNIPGVVVNISSVASERALQDHMMYCASKAALDMATKCFALELGSKKIRVNSINPTVVMTEMGRMAWSDPIKSSGLKGRIPQGRFAEVEEIVDAAIFLLSNNSSMINGQSIKVDGGFTTH